jgi:peroxiredoxin family protein
VPSNPEPSASLGILLISGGHERAHYAFVLAAGAAAVGRDVVLFATNDGCHALLADLSPLLSSRDAEIQTTGVAGLADLRDAATDLGVRLIACEAGLRMAGLTAAPLAPGVEIAGVITFLAAATGQLLTL